MTDNNISIFEVGGCVRDELLGVPTKDIDFTVVAPSFDAMRNHLLDEGFRIHTENPEFFTIRAGVPEGHKLREVTKDADFVWARREGPSSDGRHPDWVEPGSLADDLARRDFTVNALARTTEGDMAGLIIDFHDGIADLQHRKLRFVGDPIERIREDGLRVLRGFRFMVTKGFTPDQETWDALTSDSAAEMLQCVSVGRIQGELDRMFQHDTIASFDLLSKAGDAIREAIFRDGLRLAATMRA